MKITNLVTIGGTVVYISEGNGYFSQFGSFPLANGSVYKFTDKDDLYIFDGTLLQPVDPVEGDVAYGSDGFKAAVYKNGKWNINSKTLGDLCMEEEVLSAGDQDDEEESVTIPLSIGKYTIHLDLMEIVIDNFDTIAAMVDSIRKCDEAQFKTLSGKQSVSFAPNYLIEALKAMGMNPEGAKKYTHTVELL